jgi:hypothetical protein
MNKVVMSAYGAAPMFGIPGITRVEKTGCNGSTGPSENHDSFLKWPMITTANAAGDMV